MKVLIKKEYYCDRCGKFITNEENRHYHDLYSDESIMVGDTVELINYNMLIRPFKKDDMPHFSRRLENKIIVCQSCALKIAVFMGLLKGNEYDPELIKEETKND